MKYAGHRLNLRDAPKVVKMLCSTAQSGTSGHPRDSWVDRSAESLYSWNLLTMLSILEIGLLYLQPLITFIFWAQCVSWLFSLWSLNSPCLYIITVPSKRVLFTILVTCVVDQRSDVVLWAFHTNKCVTSQFYDTFFFFWLAKLSFKLTNIMCNLWHNSNGIER